MIIWLEQLAAYDAGLRRSYSPGLLRLDDPTGATIVTHLAVEMAVFRTHPPTAKYHPAALTGDISRLDRSPLPPGLLPSFLLARDDGSSGPVSLEMLRTWERLEILRSPVRLVLILVVDVVSLGHFAVVGTIDRTMQESPIAGHVIPAVEVPTNPSPRHSVRRCLFHT